MGNQFSLGGETNQNDASDGGYKQLMEKMSILSDERDLIYGDGVLLESKINQNNIGNNPANNTIEVEQQLYFLKQLNYNEEDQYEAALIKHQKRQAARHPSAVTLLRTHKIYILSPSLL